MFDMEELIIVSGVRASHKQCTVQISSAKEQQVCDSEIRLSGVHRRDTHGRYHVDNLVVLKSGRQGKC